MPSALHQRGDQRQQVHAEQDTQHDAEIAEVRQRLGGRVLLYTCHHSNGACAGFHE
jgi:hypothetical protein